MFWHSLLNGKPQATVLAPTESPAACRSTKDQFHTGPQRSIWEHRVADSEEKSIESNESGKPETPELRPGTDCSDETVDTPGPGSDELELGENSGAAVAEKQTVVESGEPPSS